MMPRMPIALSTFLVLMLAQSTFAEPVIAGAEELQASEGRSAHFKVGTDLVPPSGALILIKRVFGVPISYEWAYVESDRSRAMPTQAAYTITKGQTLRSALDNLCDMTEGRLTWKRIRGNICILPTRRDGIVESTLDTIVSLGLENVSAWEAFLEIGRLVNENPSGDRQFKVMPHFLLDSSKPPPMFRDGRNITLKLDNVTAREAVCAVIEAASFGMCYTYSNNYRPALYPNSRPTSQLMIWVYKDGKQFHTETPMPRDELFSWIREIEATLPVNE